MKSLIVGHGSWMGGLGKTLCCVAVAIGLLGAQQARAQADTVVFTAADFYGAVTQFHPIVRLATLLPAEAQAEIMQARGAFDPKLFTGLDRKEFKDQLYYNNWGAGIAVPIAPGGVDFKVTYENNRGNYVNPADITPTTGLTGVGFSVPVGQGLLIDARRATLQQARIGATLADAERLKLVNKALFDAAKTYWEWYLAHRQLKLVTEGYQLANTRFQAIRQRAILGDAAVIDTTEALITLQDRLVQRQQAEVDWQNARLRLAAFLWNADGLPVDPPAGAVPQTSPVGLANPEVLQALLDRARQQHPELLGFDAKIEQLRVEERFRRSLIQPQMNFNASLLSRTPIVSDRFDLPAYYNFRPENHKLGFDFVLPLFLRKERGKLKQVQIKAQQTFFDRQQTARDITNDVQAAWNDLRALEQQITVQERTAVYQRRLVQAEQQKFDLGESSLFLVNSRETKLIEVGVKLEELRTKYQKAFAELWYNAGTNLASQ